MPIKYGENETTVSLMGDIAVLTYGPDENTHGVAWVVLEQGPPGEPGRDTIREECPEKTEPRMFQDIQGVFIGAKDPRSLDVLIELLDIQRRKLRGEDTTDLENLRQIGREMVADIKADTERCLLDALKDPNPVGALLDIATEKAKKRERESSNDGS